MILYEIEERGYVDAFYGKDKSENYTGEYFTAYIAGQERFLLNFLEETKYDTKENI